MTTTWHDQKNLVTITTQQQDDCNIIQVRNADKPVKNSSLLQCMNFMFLTLGERFVTKSFVSMAGPCYNI